MAMQLPYRWQGSDPFVAGSCDETDGACAQTGDIARYSETEHEWCLELVGADLVHGDYFDFRAYNTTTAYGTYTVTPRLTAAITVQAGVSNTVVQAAKVTEVLGVATSALEVSVQEQFGAADTIKPIPFPQSGIDWPDYTIVPQLDHHWKLDGDLYDTQAAGKNSLEFYATDVTTWRTIG